MEYVTMPYPRNVEELKENGHRRCNLKLETIEDEEVKFFSVFIRQNSFFFGELLYWFALPNK